MSENRAQEIDYGVRIKSGGTDTALAAYFRDILINLSIDFNRFQALIDRFIITHNQVMPNTTEIATIRSAYRRELVSRTMTWKVFIKGLMFLRVEKACLQLKLFREDEAPSTHEFTFDVQEQGKGNVDEEGNTLALFFQEILHELDIEMGGQKYEELLDRYILFSKPGSSPSRLYNAKCALSREFNKNSISWKNFIKGLIFLKTQRVQFHLTLYHAHNLMSEHTKSLTFI